MNDSRRTSTVLTLLTLAFLGLTGVFLSKARPVALSPISLVDPQFTNTFTARTNLVDLMRAHADLSDFDCYACHEKGKPPPLRFDTNQVLIIPEEHKDIVMAHGRHNRNNLCFNCHNETNLELFQTRDGRELKLADSPPLCGSCHGPTYRDWEAGAHGRTSGYWDKQLGEADRKPCVSCHDPHRPKFQGRKPAPGPHPLRTAASSTPDKERSH
jgi:hypothetical protein